MPAEGFPNLKVKNVRFSLNDRLQVGNYFCGCDSNSVLRVSLVSLGSKWNIFHRAKKIQ